VKEVKRKQFDRAVADTHGVGLPQYYSSLFGAKKMCMEWYYASHKVEGLQKGK
jgi:hypothetical protein